MSTWNPDLTDVLQQYEFNLMDKMNTAIIARVIKYDPVTQKVNAVPVQSTLQANPRFMEERGRTVQEWPPLVNMPVFFPTGGGMTMTWPIKNGDTGLIIFQQESYEPWVRTGGSRPQKQIKSPYARKFNINDGIFFPGITPFCEAERRPAPTIEEDCVTISDWDGDTQIRLKKGGDIVLKTALGEVKLGSDGASDFVALADKVLSELNKIHEAFHQHGHPTHGAPPEESATSSSPPLYQVSDVSASKVKAI